MEEANLAKFTQQEVFVGVYYSAGKGFNWFCWFPYQATGKSFKEELSILPADLTK